MCVIRSFMPVGQGAFYVEQFTSCYPRINLVFDCGSSTDEKALHDSIENVFQKDETIRAVFISHLHDDQINGLEYLLSYCNVEKIYFPLLDCKAKSLTLLHNLSSKDSHKTDDFFYRFVNDPRAYLFDKYKGDKDKRTEVIYVLPDDPEFYEYRQQYGDSVRSGENVARDIDTISDDYCKWEIVPFNFRNKRRTIDLVKRLEVVFSKCFPGKKIRIDEHFELDYYWKNFRDIRGEISKAYECVEGSLNTNSMVVFSGTKANAYQQFCLSKTNDCYRCDRCCFTMYRSGCLYTGDYNCSGNDRYDA